MKVVPAALLILVGCCSGSPNPDDPATQPTVTILIWNDSEAPVAGIVSGSLGIFSMRKDMLIPPHSCKSFWVHRKYLPDHLDFKIVPIEQLGQ